MEALTRLVTESLARHGFDRPLDYRRLHWSHWFRCESPHSLLAVPSKPGVFALAEEIMDFAPGTAHVATGASPVQPARSAAASGKSFESSVEERRFSAPKDAASAAVGTANAVHIAEPRRLLAVTQFFDTDDMAFTLDRMLTRTNPMRARLASGRYFVRFVVIDDEFQRRSIAGALNQWISNAGEKVSGIGTHFASSLEITAGHVGTAALGCPAEQSSAAGAETVTSTQPWKSGPSAPCPAANVEERPSMAASSGQKLNGALAPETSTPPLDSGANSNIHCPSPLPSGF